MSVLQNIPLSQDSIKMRWQEPYVTTGLNQKAVASDLRGVLAGFRVIPSAGFSIEVQADPLLGLSIACIRDTTGGKFSLTLLQPSSLFIDLTAQAGTTVFIAVDAQYAVGSPSAAQIKVVDLAELGTNPDLVILAKVDVPGISPVLTIHINMGYRTSAGDSVLPEAPPPLNLLQNGTFERDLPATAPAGWGGFGALNPFVDNTVARSGTKSMRLSSVPPVFAFISSPPMVIAAGQLARVSLWLRSIGGSPIAGGTGVTVLVSWQDATYVQFSSTQLEANFTGGSTTWEQRLALLTAPPDTAVARVIIFFNNCSGTLYVDDVEFVVRTANHLAQSAVFGGPTVVADQFHTHTASGSYAGSPNWADGTNIPPSTIEAAIDAIPTAIGGVSGAAKVGFTPVSPVDLTAVRVDTALNELDDKKAGIAIANTFTRTNTFNPGLPNTTGIVVNANGTSPAILANGSVAGSNGVIGFAIGAGNGIYGNSPGGGVRGESTLSHGVIGNALAGSGSGVSGTGSTTGSGGVFVGGSSGEGVTGTGGGTSAGVRGIAGGGAGAHGVHGTATSGNGVQGASTAGNGVQGNGASGTSGVYGENANPGFGVAGRNTHATGTAILADATAGGVGIIINSTSTGEGAQINSNNARAVVAANNSSASITGVFSNAHASGRGLAGYGAGASGAPFPGCGVHGRGSIGGQFTGSGTSGQGLGAYASGPNGLAIEALGQGTGQALYAGMGDGNNAATVIQSAGYIHISGDNPSAGTGFSNRLVPTSIIKAWARFKYNNTANPQYFDGFNVATIVAGTGTFGANTVLDITFGAGGGMGDLNYAVIYHASTPGVYFPYTESRTTGAFKLATATLASVGSQNAPSNVTTSLNNVEIEFFVLGRQ